MAYREPRVRPVTASWIHVAASLGQAPVFRPRPTRAPSTTTKAPHPNSDDGAILRSVRGPVVFVAMVLPLSAAVYKEKGRAREPVPFLGTRAPRPPAPPRSRRSPGTPIG